jgi:6-phosphogluconate dehydrogenase
MKNSDIGLIGLAVMGENLALNMESNGFTVSVFNRTVQEVDRFMQGRGKGKNFFGAHSIREFVDSIGRPRKIMFMIKAGQPVDDLIGQVIPFLDKGDIIIDGGNSNFQDTDRRTKFLEEKGFLFIGTGISGGEEGALNGPSIMPGGSKDAWPLVKPIFQKIAAKLDDGTPCCDWVGENGAGHFVKMVHNGIEYGDMQLIAEAYFMMKQLLGMDNDAMHNVMEDWNNGELNSYLIEITANILDFKDSDESYLVDNILDTAGQKGTGKWTGIAALDEGIPLTLIVEAVFARSLSALKDERVEASGLFKAPPKKARTIGQDFTREIHDALYASKLISYTQGYTLMRQAAQEYKWNLNYGGIAQMWRGGCIIRSAFLGKITEAFKNDPGLENLLFDPFFKQKIETSIPALRKVVSAAAIDGIATPAHFAALSYFDGLRSEELPANLVQAQRDYFGAHTYERKDQPRGKFFHTNWTGKGGTTSSGSYTA